MNKLELSRFLESLFDFRLSIPILLDLADLAAGKNRVSGPLKRRLERLHIRLCRVQEELSRLELKKAALGATLGINGYKTFEDFVFNQIDFSRYRKIAEKDFALLFLDGLTDFDEAFFKKNFALGHKEIQSAIEQCYKKTAAESGQGQAGGAEFILQRENPLVLSVMRTLETSLETSPFFTVEEITKELQNMPYFSGEKHLPGIRQLYPHLVLALDSALFTHSDGMTTKLFISPAGDLLGTFRPGNKPWTLVLIPQKNPD